MKYLSIFLLFICVSISNSFAQKHDYIWLTGTSSQSNPLFAGTTIDFNTIPPDIYYEFRGMYFYQTNASICDTIGNLLFYTNGIYVANALHEVMENGGNLNPGAHADAHIDDGYILDQGAMILPMPEDDSLYYLLHLDRMTFGDEGVYGSSKHFYYTLIDMNTNDGLGKVIVKNQVIKEGVFELGKLTTTRHANGRDWWILLRAFNTNRYYTFLVTPYGISEESVQAIGDSIPSPGVGQAVFSPDGTKFANLHLVNGIGTEDYIGIYDFDRCSGQLSNPQVIAYADSAWAGGVAISPNSRYLYVSSFLRVFQYDLWANDIEASQDTVAEWDGFVEGDFFATTFYLAQLAPDGKIYINTNNSTSYLHVIEKPDLPGDSCQVCQHCIDLPSWNSFTLPNFPNYRLYHEEGSPCDTLRQPPVAAFFASQEDVLLYSFQDASFHDIRSWYWEFGDGVIDSVAHPIHLYSQEGNYEVCLTVENPRGVDMYCESIQVSATSTQDILSQNIRAMPNPTSGELVLQFPTQFIGGVLRIYDVTGQFITSYSIDSNVQDYILSLEQYGAGVFILEIESEAGRLWQERVVSQ